jgi:hypothetical protein
VCFVFCGDRGASQIEVLELDSNCLWQLLNAQSAVQTRPYGRLLHVHTPLPYEEPPFLLVTDI